jgi:hypothetical protein
MPGRGPREKSEKPAGPRSTRTGQYSSTVGWMHLSSYPRRVHLPISVIIGRALKRERERTWASHRWERAAFARPFHRAPSRAAEGRGAGVEEEEEEEEEEAAATHTHPREKERLASGRRERLIRRQGGGGERAAVCGWRLAAAGLAGDGEEEEERQEGRQRPPGGRRISRGRTAGGGTRHNHVLHAPSLEPL